MGLRDSGKKIHGLSERLCSQFDGSSGGAICSTSVFPDDADWCFTVENVSRWGARVLPDKKIGIKQCSAYS
jgi:hypothetical protein